MNEKILHTKPGVHEDELFTHKVRLYKMETEASLWPSSPDTVRSQGEVAKPREGGEIKPLQTATHPV